MGGLNQPQQNMMNVMDLCSRAINSGNDVNETGHIDNTEIILCKTYIYPKV